MISEETELEVGDMSYPARINQPEEETARGVVFMPGVSSGPWGRMFDRLAERAAGEGTIFLRFESWEGAEDLNEKTLGDIHQEIDRAIEMLQEEGCSEISMVGKSFGGGTILTHVPEEAEKLILWAPAVGVGEKGNVSEWKDRKLEEAKSAMDIKVGEGNLEGMDIPVKVIHGTEDQVVPLENSHRIVGKLGNGEMVDMEGAGHSYEKKEYQNRVIEETMDVLN